MAQILNTVVPVFLIILISYLIDKKKKINLDPLIDIVIYIATPCLVFSAIQKHELVLTNFFKIALSAIVVVLASGLIGHFVLKLLKIKKKELLLPMMFMNSGNMGYPINLFAFGALGLSMAGKFDVFNALLVFSLGVYIAKKKASIKEVFKLPLVYAAVLGIIFALFKLQLPTIIMRPIDLVAGAAIPLQLIILGMSLTKVDLKDLKLAFFGSAYRIGVGFALGLIMVSILKPETLPRNVILLESAMPSALFSVILAQKYNRDAGLVASTVLISTILSVLTISVILFFL
ncbi:AEC family transporter [Candidatus Woesearchaeota archaeon]|nr:AEC family transporter [Candidatus Woesearchaeota archaeon]